MRFLLTCLVLLAIFSIGVYIGEKDFGSDATLEPSHPDVDIADADTIKQEVEQSIVEIIPLESKEYEPGSLYNFAEKSSHAVGKVADSILSVCNDFIDILF